MSETADAVIVGAGIVGAACAAELANAGWKVLVVDEHIPGGGATAAGMGHVVVMDDSDAQFQLTRYSQLLWRELAAELPRQAEYTECGTIWVAADEEELNEARRKQGYCRERNVPAELLDARALEEAEPNLRAGLAGGLRVAQDAIVYPPVVAAYLLQRAQGLGARVRLGRRVTAVDDEGARCAEGARFAGGAIVNATGARAAELTPAAAVAPRKGHLLITDRYPGFARHQLVELGYLKSAHGSQEDSVAFNIQPRPGGQILIGSSRQFGRNTAEVENPMLARMLARALEYMPALGRLRGLRAWTGFRAATTDSLPLIGICPGFRNVWLATGHEGLGITTALGTAKLLAAQLTGREAAIPAGPYQPDRAGVAHG